MTGPITKQAIFAAADELDAEGVRVTLQAVRKKVGGGSFTTISEAVSEWRKSKGAKAAEAAEAPPQPLADKLAAFGAELWAGARDMANERLAAERAALDDDRRTLEVARVEAVQLADGLTAEVEDLRERLAALQESARLTSRALDERTQELAVSTQRANSADSLIASLQAQGARSAADADRLRSERDEARQAAAASAAKAQEAAELAATLRGQVGALQAAERQSKEAAADLAAQLMRAAELAATLRGQMQALQDSEGRATAQAEAMRSERDMALQKAADSAAKAQEAAEQAATLRGQLQALKPGARGAKP